MLEKTLATYMIAVMLITFASGCTKETATEPQILRPIESNEISSTSENDTYTTSTRTAPDELILSEEIIIPEEDCKARGMYGKVIIIESSSCSACKALHPVLRRIEENLNMEFLFLDRTLTKDRNIQDEMHIQAKYTPTVIANCNIYIGVKSEDKYKALIEKSFSLE